VSNIVQAARDGGRQAARGSLDQRTQLVVGGQWGWGVRAFPLVGEANAVWRSPQSAARQDRGKARGVVESVTSGAQSNRERVARRRRTAMRRYCVQNRLARLVTLTFAPVHGAGPGHYRDGVWVCTAQAAEDGWCVCGRPWGVAGRNAALMEFARWVRRRRVADRGEAFAYLAVAEPHADGHWHLHVAVSRATATRELVASRWGHGNVDPGVELRGPGRSLRERARLAARYCAKYAGKDLAGVPPNGQAYRVAEGFGVRVVTAGFFRDLASAVRVAQGIVGDPVEAVWTSGREWDGPPVAVITFREGPGPP
jgi:hypothetical protein